MKQLLKIVVLTILVVLGCKWQVEVQSTVTVPITITHVAGCEVTGRFCYAEFTTHYTERAEEVAYYTLTAREHAQLTEGRTGMYYKSKFETLSNSDRTLTIINLLATFCFMIWLVSTVWDVVAAFVKARKIKRNEAYLTVQRGKHRRSAGDSTSGETRRSNNSQTNDSFLGGFFFGSSPSDGGGSGGGSSEGGGGGSD